MKCGIIGTGNMGSMLARVFIESGALKQDDISIYNRTKEKAETLQDLFTHITIAEQLADLPQSCDVLFLCVKPHDYSFVLQEISANLSNKQCLVSITSPVAVEELEDVTEAAVARIVPSITNHAHAGVSLFTFGKRVSPSTKQDLWSLFEHFSTPIEIEEPYIRVASDMVSCGPAFISFLLKEWIESAHEVAGISREKATALTEAMMVGTGELFNQKIFTLEQLMEKVTVKGGVTGEGLHALEKHIGHLFTHMFKATQEKHKEDKAQIHLS